LLEIPATVTTTSPDTAFVGRVRVMALSAQVVTAVVDPFIEMLLAPWLEPNPAPVIFTSCPVRAGPGLMLVMIGPLGLTDTRRDMAPDALELEAFVTVRFTK
jgi:hypothetical protein